MPHESFWSYWGTRRLLICHVSANVCRNVVLNYSKKGNLAATPLILIPKYGQLNATLVCGELLLSCLLARTFLAFVITSFSSPFRSLRKRLWTANSIIGVFSFVCLQVPHPYLSALVDLSRVDTMFGLSERIIATESL